MTRANIVVERDATGRPVRLGVADDMIPTPPTSSSPIDLSRPGWLERAIT